MKSMTGYGYAEKANPLFSLSVEVKSYNNRYLEIVCNLPPFLGGYELDLTKAVSKVAARGRVEIFVKVKRFKSDMSLLVDQEAVALLSEAFGQISVYSGKALKPTLGDYLSQEGVLVASTERDSEIYREDLLSALDEALLQFGASKEREGEATALVLQGWAKRSPPVWRLYRQMPIASRSTSNKTSLNALKSSSVINTTMRTESSKR